MSGALIDADFPLTVIGNVVFRSTSSLAMVTLPTVELAADIATRLNMGEHDRRERIAALRKRDVKDEVLAAYEEERAPPPLGEQLGSGDGWSFAGPPMPPPPAWGNPPPPFDSYPRETNNDR